LGARGGRQQARRPRWVPARACRCRGAASDRLERGAKPRGWREEGRLVCGGPPRSGGADLRWLRGEALALLAPKRWPWREISELKVERCAVGDPRSRWGSCSSARAIRYSWRLIMAPDFVRRATVAHESRIWST
jgi:hypothetical protein